MIQRDKHIPICTVLIVMNLAFIWGNSLLPGDISGVLSDWVKEVLEKFLPGGEMSPSGGGLLRKIAHFLEFTSLGFLLSWQMVLRHKRKYLALLIGVTVACVDETIQMFVPERGPGILDVGIDSCGVLTGILLLQIGNLLLKNVQLKRYGGKQR